MTAIAPITMEGAYKVLRNAAAQANTGQTDWVNVPAWAKSATFTLNITASAGTTPGPVQFHLRAADPVSRDDADIATIYSGASVTTLTTTHWYSFGPTLTSAGTDSASADSWVVLNTVLPPLLGAALVLDRTDGSETYTYTLALQFKG